jgi:hypothetical protein
MGKKDGELMPFSIKVKGKSYEARPLPYSEDADPEEKPNYDALVLVGWEAYCMMADARRDAIGHYEPYEKLGKQMDTRGPKHPQYGQAMRRLHDWEGLIVTSQVLFLRMEERINRIWQSMGKSRRQELGFTDWLSLDSRNETTYGLWRHSLALSPLPPQGFVMLPVSLLIATPQQKSVYLDAMKGGLIHEPVGQTAGRDDALGFLVGNAGSVNLV